MAQVRHCLEMSFEESLDYDFRVRSLTSLIDRLEEYAIAMNGPSSMYSRAAISNAPLAGGELDPLFPVGRSAIYLVVGPPCAGKTTMGMYGLQNLECQVIDASAVVRSKREDTGQSDLEISEFARRLLSEEGTDVIARSIAHSFSAGTRDKALIVTGFRAIEEIQFFRESFLNVKVISVEAPARLRYERYLRRGTRALLESYDRFREHDAEQRAFGLLGIAPLLANVHVRNVYSKEIFYRQAAQVFDLSQPDVPGVVGMVNRMDPETSQLYRCLIVLRTAGRPLTTQEIQRDFEDGHFVLYNNANKMLKRYPELATRQESGNSNVRYHITQAGLAFLAAVDWLHSHS